MAVQFFRSRYRLHRKQLRQFIYHDLFHADDPPQVLALGMAVGVFVAFTPTVGVQMVFAGFLGWLLGANKAVSIASVWISNPATMLPMYWYSYGIGCAILTMDPINHQWWTDLTTPPHGWWATVRFYWSRFLEIAGPLWLGSLVVGSVCAYVTYYATHCLIASYRNRMVRQNGIA